MERSHFLAYCCCMANLTVAVISVSLYQGTVFHKRRRPVHHSFRYALIDARRIAGTAGQTLILTIPESVGYEQNPLSLYYCYDDDLILKRCIAEVNNTPRGEGVLFVLNPDSDLVAKPLHVSPFMDMLGNWSIRGNAPDENLFVSISVQHPDLGNYFTATRKAKRVPSSLVSDHALFFWLMPHKVAVWIYWHAKRTASLSTRQTEPSYHQRT